MAARLTAAGLVLLIAGCAAGGHAATRSSAVSSQLTVTQARQAFASFLPRFLQLPSSFSAGAARNLTVGAELQAQLFFHGPPGPALTQLTSEAFYVPRLTSYPHWFWAVGLQPGSSHDSYLFVMVQTGPSASWKAALTLYDLNSSSGMLHQLAATITTGSEGYAESVPPGDPTLDVAPSAMPRTFASYLDGTSTAAVTSLFQAGPNTTGYRALNRTIARGARRYGWQDTDHQSPSGLPVYALRINTGGAIVIFTTYDSVGWRAEASSAALPMRPSQREANYVPPAFVIQDLHIRSVKAGTQLTASAADAILAFVQPQGVGYIYPLIVNGAATGVAASGPR
jgi:hypothetical protein